MYIQIDIDIDVDVGIYGEGVTRVPMGTAPEDWCVQIRRFSAKNVAAHACASVCVCVCVRERESVCVCVRESV